MKTQEKNLKVKIEDGMGNTTFVNSDGRSWNQHKIAGAFTNLQWICDMNEVIAETGNRGTKHYKLFMMARLNLAVENAEDNETFAREMNRVFKTDRFVGA